MSIATPLSYVFLDCITSLGVGFVICAIYQAIRFCTKKSKTVVFITDILIFIIASMLLFSYVVSFSYTQMVRWYIVLGALLGYSFYAKFVMQKCFVYEQKIKKTLAIPVKFIALKLNKLFLYTTSKINACKLMKKPKKINAKKLLQSNAKVLYNSNSYTNCS